MTPAQLKASLEDTSRNWAARAEREYVDLALRKERERRIVDVICVSIGMLIGLLVVAVLILVLEAK